MCAYARNKNEDIETIFLQIIEGYKATLYGMRYAFHLNFIFIYYAVAYEWID